MKRILFFIFLFQTSLFAQDLEKAVQNVLNDGLRTKDILSDGMKEVSTSQMGDAIISKLQ